MPLYEGSRTIDGIHVTVDGTPLDPRYDLHRYSNSGFEWTYEGDAPNQLALAILADHLGDGDRARHLGEAFMKTKIANLENDWSMTSEDVAACIDGLAGEAA